ncbi:DUF885 family protein [Actinocrispum wychmicini]|uniref:Uncharacterized protein DUF885 n=1 Tax=Actinocrispum wychmicini TaxID=1213861 RepID=A0A4R2JKL0_9PSEU|nr:DUF885 family protein [Actinocrispum wychmicini]TCO59694.1 uncharacterized protein DUF885 [Actinocrispum wychmicini]
MTNHLSTGPVQLTDQRLRAVCDLSIADARQFSGLHGYDGVVQDLSPTGVKAGLAALASAASAPQSDPHDEAQLAAAVTATTARFGELELHRVNPMWHILNLDVSCYDREYAPAAERAAARDRHVAQWPDAVDGAIESLDRPPAAVADAALPLARGLASFLGPDEETARAAHARLIRFLEHSAEHGDPDPGMGATAFERLLATSEACSLSVNQLAARAEAECQRMQELLDDACRRVDNTAPAAATIAALRADHPTADTLVPTFSAAMAEAIAWTTESGLFPEVDGVCEVAVMPESQRWAAAGLFGAAPNEPDAPSRFYVTPPDPALSTEDQERWLASYFNRATLPVMTIHEVSPGHFAHSRAHRRVVGEVRRTLSSEGFTEGWAHYTEQLAVEEGFRGHDPVFAVGMALDALRRIARLRCAIGIHTGELTMAEAAAMVARDAHLTGPGTRSEVRRGLLDPGYGRYTWGKLAILDLRERAKAGWGTGFSLSRFHKALLSFGSPPLGLLDTVIERG